MPIYSISIMDEKGNIIRTEYDQYNYARVLGEMLVLTNYKLFSFDKTRAFFSTAECDPSVKYVEEPEIPVEVEEVIVEVE